MVHSLDFEGSARLLFFSPRSMRILINNTVTEVSDGTTLGMVLRRMQFPESGIAVAIDNKVVPCTLWDTTLLSADSRITVIRAVCGG